jgi:hypothetical protein
MVTIQYITDGVNGRDERVVLWRLGEYQYELEIGSGLNKRNLKFYETEYYEALEYFNDAIQNYQPVDDYA